MARVNARWMFSRIGLMLLVIMCVQLFSQMGFMTRKCLPDQHKDEMEVTFKRLTNDEKAREEKITEKIAVHTVEEKITENVVQTRPFVNDDLEGKLSNVDKATIAADLKRLAVELTETQRDSITLPVSHRIEQHVRTINNLLRKLHEEELQIKAPQTAGHSVDKKSPKNEVCPEKFLGKNLAYGYPYFRTGFERINCTNYIPLIKLVTVIIDIPKQLPKPADSYVKVLENVARLFPGILVIFATDGPLSKMQQDSISKLKIIFQHHRSAGARQGRLWQELLGKVQTPYVLIAPDITHFTDDIFLERLVRIISDNDEVVLSGGSYRNLNGEWNMGCQQSSIKNWTLTYREGYYHSFSDCVVCDYVPGPWVASTDKLRSLGFDESLPEGAFNDLFFRLKQNSRSQIAVSCPDIMFNVQPRDVEDAQYVTIAQKHKVKKWVEANGRVRWYGCRRGYHYLSGSASCSLTKGIGVPPCDLANLAEVVKFIMKECEDAGLFCELQEGTLLGAVKFGKVLPWERDADITFLTANYTAFKRLAPKFAEAGYSLSDDDGSLWCCVDGRQAGGKFRVGTTRWTVEMYGQHLMESEMLVAKGEKPTKIIFDGQWVNMVRNPGLYARNRYGPNHFRHAEHWMDTGHSTGWSFYHPSKFSPCPYPGHSACLDQYPADGNFQFT